MTISGSFSRLDRFIIATMMVSLAVLVVADSTSFLRTGTIAQDLYWSNISFIVGLVAFVATKKLEE